MHRQIWQYSNILLDALGPLGAIRRSIILDRVSTSLALEADFWDELDRQAAGQGLSWADYARRLLSGESRSANRAAAIKQILLKSVGAAAGSSETMRLRSAWNVLEPDGEREIRCDGARLVVGRDVGCQIALKDRDVSRRHLMLANDGKHWWAIDLGSKNGTFVDRKRTAVSRLKRQSRVQVGGSELRLMR